MLVNTRYPSALLALASISFCRLAFSQGPVYAWGDNTYGQSDAGPAAAVSAGGVHSMALIGSSGHVLAWGDNNAGESNVPAGLSNCLGIAAGYWHNVAIRSDGTVAAWGDNTYGQLKVPLGLSTVKKVSSGYLHTLALRANGTVAAWGDNSAGQCNVPVGLAGITAVSAGGYHSLALRSTGTVVVWGDNSVGQLNVPGNLTSVIAVSAGAYHNLALRSNGTVVAWGDDTYGQIDVPAGLDHVVSVAAGERFSLALKADGTVTGWGDNQYGEVKPPSTLNNAVAISAGAFHALALTSNGEVVGWGENYRGEARTPPGLGDYVSISAGQNFNLAATPNGIVDAWGDNTYGQCNAPLSQFPITHVSAGYHHGDAFISNVYHGWEGMGVAWGDNSYGQTNVPSIVIGNVFNHTTRTVEAGGFHSLALVDGDEPGLVYAWGDNTYGQCNIPSGLYTAYAISGGAYHSLVIGLDGNVYAFGRNDSGQCNVPPGTTNAIAVAAGGFHSMALLPNHTVVAWGDNTYGQCNVPAGLSNVVAIAAGGYHSLALKADGTVVAWGRNDSGQCNVPAGLSGIGAISAGFNNSLALSAAPRAFNKTFPADANKTITVPAAGVLAGDYNPGKAVLLTATNHGSVSLASDGSFTYTPVANFTGVDSFTYKDVSAMGESNAATVTLIVYEHLLTCTVAPTSVIGGIGATGTVHLQIAAPSTGRYVHLASDNKAASVPTYALVPAGLPVGSFPITTYPVDATSTVHITAVLGTSTAVGVLTVSAPILSSFTLQQSKIVGGTGTTGVLTLTGKAGPSGVTITLAKDNGLAIVPASATIAANQNSKSFAISSTGVAQNTIVNLTATYGTVQKSAALTLTPSSIQSITVKPTSLVGGASATGTVVLNGQEGSPVGVVYLQSDLAAANVPGYVLVPQLQSSAAFTFNTLGVDSAVTATIKATLNGLSKTASLTIIPATIAKMTLSAMTVTGGSGVTGTISLNGLAGPSGVVVTLRSNTSAASVPASVFILQGTQSQTFKISTQKVATATKATIVGLASGRGQAYQVLTINP